VIEAWSLRSPIREPQGEREEMVSLCGCGGLPLLSTCKVALTLVFEGA